MFNRANAASPLSRRALWLLLVVFTTIWFGTLEYRKLIKPDEGRYAEIAREMAVTGDFVTPRLNGLKYFEKPPLQYWATATAFKVFGEDEWTARLWPGLTGYLSVLLAFFTARRLFGERVALFTGLVHGSSLWMIMIGHINTLDMGLTFFLQLALTGVLLANSATTPDTSRRGWALLTWVALALAVLSKGLVALVLSGGTLVVYSLLSRDLSPWKRMYWLPGLALFFLIATPWFVLVSQANPEFPRFFFWHEHFERFLTKQHGRYQPGWYFIPILAIGAMPWTLMVIHAWLKGWRQPAEDNGFQPVRLLLVWSALVFAFFSVSHSKLPSYILPILPATAIITGLWLANVSRELLLRHFIALSVLAAACLPFLIKVANFADNETPTAMMTAYAKWLAVSGGIWLAGCIFGIALIWRKTPQLAPLVLAVAALCAGTGVLQGHEKLGRSNSSNYISKQLTPLLVPGIPFYSVKMYEQTLPFYIKRTLTLVEYRDEMGFGLDQQPELGVPDMATFHQRWAQDKDAFAIMTPDTFQQLSAERFPMQEVARDTRRVIVRKPQP